MAILNFLAYSAVYLAMLTMVVASAVFPVLLVSRHRKAMRELAPPPVPAGPPPQDPDIAWVLADDPDPAAVARLQEELARPLSELVAEGERRAIAAYCPLKGDPHEATVAGPPLTEEQVEVLRKRLLSSTRSSQVMVLSQDATYIPLPQGPAGGVSGGDSWTHYSGHALPAGGGGSGTNSIEVTAVGDRERSYVMGPPDPAGDDHPLDSTGQLRVTPEVLRKLRHRRLRIWNDAKFLADQACDESRTFTDAEADRWEVLHQELTVLDERIMGVLKVLDRRGEL